MGADRHSVGRRQDRDGGDGGLAEGQGAERGEQGSDG